MVVELDLTTQPYWNLANICLQAIGPGDGQTWKTKGSYALDIRHIFRNTRVVLGYEVGVKSEAEEKWTAIDLHKCYSLM